MVDRAWLSRIVIWIVICIVYVDGDWDVVVGCDCKGLC